MASHSPHPPPPQEPSKESTRAKRSTCTGVTESTAQESIATPVRVWVTRNPASDVPLRKPCSFKVSYKWHNMCEESCGLVALFGSSIEENLEFKSHLPILLTFVMPSRMCISPIHNKKGILHHSDNVSSEERWAASSCAMDSLYDMDFISDTVPVILDNSKLWHQVLSTSMKLGDRGVAHVEGVNRVDLKENSRYSNLLLINRTASPLSWFMECKDRNNRSAIMLPYSFLPSRAAKELRDAADKN
uniref:Uncharacterized protein n=1 Tax=Fagus sylvatica TaxID=28930 RepID=A0A2N9G541_FAGSY